MTYLVAASLTRRVAPSFAPTIEARGDTLTVDATDGVAWRYVSLDRGRVLTTPDTTPWDLAVRRYNVRIRGRGELGKWYRYSLLTHLLEPKREVYVVQSAGGRAFEVKIVSYYCPGLTAGCVTLTYVPVVRGD